MSTHGDWDMYPKYKR